MVNCDVLQTLTRLHSQCSITVEPRLPIRLVCQSIFFDGHIQRATFQPSRLDQRLR